MTLYRYPEIKLTASRKTASGKRQRKTFSQTLNPLNRTDRGLIKTSEQVIIELHEESQAWIKQGESE